MRELLSCLLTEKVRRYIYGIIISCLPILVFYGFIEAEALALIASASLAILGLSLASVNVGKKGVDTKEFKTKNVSPTAVKQKDFDHQYYQNRDEYLA